MMGVPRPIRAVAAIIVLVALFFVVWGWWGDYRAEKGGTRSPDETTATVEPEAEVDDQDGAAADTPPADAPPTTEPRADAQTVVVLIEGLNFRRNPSRDGELIRGLGRGTRLEYLGTADGWYHVRDDRGTEGYVSASEQYTELQ